MKNIFLLACVLVACFLCGCDTCKVARVEHGRIHFTDHTTNGIAHWNEEGWTHFFFVRHAERLDEPADGLTDAGKARAKRLGEMMKDADLNLVFTTRTIRTRSTADSVRVRYNNIPAPTPEYPNEDLAETAWLQQQLHDNRGKHIFVVGHSDTVLRMIRKLVRADNPLRPTEGQQLEGFGNFLVVASPTETLGSSEFRWLKY